MGEIAQSVIAEAAGEAVHCLRCGYDLRGSAADRCSECGWEIDRDLLSGGFFPWERRRYRGRFISYVKTVWQVSAGSRKLREAAGRRHALADALSFARVTGALVAIALVGIFFLTLGKGEIWRLAISAQTGWPPPPARAVWVEELIVPWSAGVTLLPVVPVMLVILAFFATRAPARLLVAKDADPAAAESGEAIGCYASAPLVWLLPVGILFAALGKEDEMAMDVVFGFLIIGHAAFVAIFGIWVRVRHALKRTKPNIFFMPGMLLAGAIILMIPFWLGALGATMKDLWLLPLSAAGAVILLTMVRIVQCSGRVRKLGAGRSIVQGAHLIGLWLLQTLVLLGILPWCIGLVWIVVDSFQ